MASAVRVVRVAVLALAVLLAVAGCGQRNQLGARPAETVMDSVETYLQRYQPGPEPRLFQTSRIYDRHGIPLAELWDEGRRTWLSLDRISPHLIDATIATEDATFYSNLGVDPARIAGAALQNAQEGQIVSGASTITMQLARNLFLGADDRYDQTMDRKVLEAGLAQELTTLFSKDELLEMYLNLLNYGHLAYGPEAAAQVYFDKPAAELTLAEATLLAGIPQEPANLDPYRNLEGARARQRIVLDLMVRHNVLSQAEAEAAFEEELVLRADPNRQDTQAPHFVQYLEQYVDARLEGRSIRRSGFEITTTLDLPMQDLAQSIVAEKVAQLRPQYDLSNGALVAIRPATGELLAMVGSADFNDPTISGQVNVAVSPRQPGSALKPILYATALEDNLISPASVLWDVPVTYTIATDNVYSPVNYDGQFHGPVTVRTALANSYNVAAVKLLDALGVERMLESARTMGITSLDRGGNWYGLSLTLGGGEVTLLDLTTAYATLANQGTYVKNKLILSASDGLGRPVQIDQPKAVVQAISPGIAFLVTDILSDSAARTPAFGANSILSLSQPAAAKTGTTNDWRDNWTLGFTRYLVAGVWAGNSDGHSMRNTSGLTGAAPIWHEFMEGVLADPAMLDSLDAPSDPAFWSFDPPPSVVQLVEATGEVGLTCPPGLVCREGGEYFSQAWLAAMGDASPLADSVALSPTAPVYVDQGDGSPRWTAYCRVEPALLRPLLKLPNGALGVPQDALGAEVQVDDAVPLLDDHSRMEQQHAIAWSLRHPTAVDLGPCDQLGEVGSRALALGGVPGQDALRILVDLAAAMDPNAGPVAGSEGFTLAYLTSGGPGQFALAEPIAHNATCPGNYIVGRVLDGGGGPMAGVHILMVDQWGNRADAISKDGPSDYGHYDFPLHYFPNRYTLSVIDGAGNPLSPAVVVDHLQGDAGEAPCHSVVWQGS